MAGNLLTNLLDAVKTPRDVASAEASLAGKVRPLSLSARLILLLTIAVGLVMVLGGYFILRQREEIHALLVAHSQKNNEKANQVAAEAQERVEQLFGDDHNSHVTLGAVTGNNGKLGDLTNWLKTTCNAEVQAEELAQLDRDAAWQKVSQVVEDHFRPEMRVEQADWRLAAERRVRLLQPAHKQLLVLKHFHAFGDCGADLKNMLRNHGIEHVISDVVAGRDVAISAHDVVGSARVPRAPLGAGIEAGLPDHVLNVGAADERHGVVAGDHCHHRVDGVAVRGEARRANDPNLIRLQRRERQ